MALKSGSLGTMLQGVSQQPDRVRLEGQVTEQVNLISDVTLGLSSRPTTDDLSTLTGASTAQKFQDIRFKDTTYIFGFEDGPIRAWTVDGTEVVVNVDIGVVDYIGPDLRFHVVEDQIVMLNRDKVVAVEPNAATPNSYTAVISLVGGQFSRDYELTLTFGDASTFTVTYSTPDGTSPGDAEQTSSEAIATGIYDALLADGAWVTYAAANSVTLTRVGAYILVSHPTETVAVKVADGEQGFIMRYCTDRVDDLDDLPKYADNGKVVRVVSSAASEDDVWLRFNADDVTTEDGIAGFGVDGVWEEWYNPYEDREFDLTTMPHVLTLNEGTGELSVEQGPWLGRQVGDSVTAPFVNIVGKRIRDINGFEGRLVLLTNDYCVMSRTKEPFDLWRETATGKVDSDPIDITSTSKDSLELDWIVPFDRDLFLFEDPGDGQFLITGGGLTADNASMVLTTEFTVSSAGTPPVSNGRTILFPFRKGQYSGIKDFYTASNKDANDANTLTETVDRYLDGAVTKITVSQNFNLALFLTDVSPNTIYTYKYLWDGTELLQSSWSKWNFLDEVLYCFFDNEIVHIICINDAGEVFLHTMDLDRPLNEYGFHLSIDRKQERVVADGYVDLPFDHARFMQHTNSPFPGREAVAAITLEQAPGLFRYYFNTDTIPNGSTLVCGQTMLWQLKPTEVFARDYRGNIDTSKRVTIQEYILHLSNSGEVKADFNSPYYEDTYTFEDGLFALDGEPLDPDLVDLLTGELSIPWGERADWSKLTLWGDDLKSVTMLELSWNGQVLKSKGNR